MAPLGQGERHGADLILDGQPTHFWITIVEYDYLVGFWVPSLRPATVTSTLPAGILQTLAAADSVVISTPAFDIPLSPAAGDPENRAAFVEACMAL